MHLGGWRTHQRRSYFAVQITERWWVWALDAQLADDIDQPQADYFRTIAASIPAGAKIILCGPEPGWLYTKKKGNRALSVMDYVAWAAKNRSLSVPLVLSGDTHHYSRYEGSDGETQFITSGGGGAFLHSTHQVEEEVNLDRKDDRYYWLDGKVKKLTLGESGGVKAVYPSKAESLSMLGGNFAFVAYNPAFAMVLGVVYWPLTLIAGSFPSDIYWIAPIVLISGFWAYTRNQEGGGWKTVAVSAGNGLLHTGAVLLVTRLVARLNALYLADALASVGRLVPWLNSTEPGLAGWPRTVFVVTGIETVLIGGIIAGFLFGAYLYITSRWFDMNHNDAFSSMRRDSHRHFLRLRVKGDEVTVFPIGLTKVPKRHEWVVNTSKQGSPPPAYVPDPALAPHMIEPAVTVRPKRV